MMRKCGLNTWCCHGKNSDMTCCDGGQLFGLESPIETVTLKVTQEATQAPPQLIFSTIQVVSVLTIEQTLSRSTLKRPSLITPSIVESSASSGQPSTPPTARITSTQDLHGNFTQSTAIESHSSCSSPNPPSTPVTVIPSTPQATSTTTPAGQIEPRTALGLGVGLSAVVALATVGLIFWFVRTHRHRRTKKRKVAISSPIGLEPIPMLEFANTDWELPVDGNMPTELSANGQTPQTWL